MKAGWSVERLGSLCEIYQPKTISKKMMLPDGEYPVFGANGIIGRYDKYNHESPELLVTCRGATCGSVNISKAFSWINGNAMVVRPKDDRISKKYLEYFFRGAVDLDGVITGAAQPQITRKSLAPVWMSFPPLEEQKRIVAVLDAAFEGLDRARADTEANLQNARDLFASYVNHVFTENELNGTKVKFSDIATIESVLVDPRDEPFLDLPHLGAGNMVSGRDEVVSVKTSREEKLKSGKFPFDSRMILYSKIRPYLRKVARPSFEGVCSADVYPLLPVPDVMDKNYLFHLLLGPDFTQYAIAGSDRVGMPKVNRKHLFSYELYLPDLETQKSSVSKIDVMMKKTDIAFAEYETKLTDLDDLRQSLLQKAFAGELT